MYTYIHAYKYVCIYLVVPSVETQLALPPHDADFDG